MKLRKRLMLLRLLAVKGIGAAMAPTLIAKILLYILFDRYLFALKLLQNGIKRTTSSPYPIQSLLRCPLGKYRCSSKQHGG
jgi:hypothetical protein